MSEKIPGWNPEASGREAGRLERAERYGSARAEQMTRQREYAEFMGRKAENGGRMPKADPEPDLIAEKQEAAKAIGEQFMAEVGE